MRVPYNYQKVTHLRTAVREDRGPREAMIDFWRSAKSKRPKFPIRACFAMRINKAQQSTADQWIELGPTAFDRHNLYFRRLVLYIGAVIRGVILYNHDVQ